MRPSSRHTFRKLATLVGTLSLAAACQLPTNPSKPAVLRITSGDQQTAAVGTMFPNPLVASVYDQFGVAMTEVTIIWEITAGGGALSATTTKTDKNGSAAVTYTGGPTAGIATISVTLPGFGTITFEEMITAKTT